MNENHDPKSGEFSSGGGSGNPVPTSRMQRFVANTGQDERHAWMARTRDNARHPNAGEVHARQDQVAATAHEHQKVPTFGKRH